MAAQKKVKPTEPKMGPIETALREALDRASWITPTDAGAVVMALRLAQLLDGPLLESSPQVVPPFIARYQAQLQQLHLTPETRIASGEIMEDGSVVQDRWAGILGTPYQEQSAPGVPKRRPSSKRPSGGSGPAPDALAEVHS